MKIRNLNIIMMLTAGVIVSIIYLVKGYSLMQLTYTLLVVLIIFFIIGTLIQYFVNRIIINVDNNEINEKVSNIDEQINEIDKKTKEDNLEE